MPLATEHNEWLFDAMAQALDEVDSRHHGLLLAKFSMLLANAVGDHEVVAAALRTSLEHVPVNTEVSTSATAPRDPLAPLPSRSGSAA
jgi:type III secretory pathway component EscT